MFGLAIESVLVRSFSCPHSASQSVLQLASKPSQIKLGHLPDPIASLSVNDGWDYTNLKVDDKEVNILRHVKYDSSMTDNEI